jgi:hypothetical protein
VANIYLRRHCVYLDSSEKLRKYLLLIPDQPKLRTIRSLTLDPFSRGSIDDWAVCSWIRELFNFTCESLSKLIIDMPLRTCYPTDDHLGVRPVLREAFERLVNLEEFVSTKDDLYLDTRSEEYALIWTKWPKLKRMALYGVYLDSRFWQQVALHPSLEVLALTSPLVLTAPHVAEPQVEPKSAKPDGTPFKVIHCAYWFEEPFGDIGLSLPRDSKVNIVVREIPGPQNVEPPFPGGFVKSRAEDGTLWEESSEG